MPATIPSKTPPLIRLLSVSDLHGDAAWMNWIVAQAPAYDALLFPGDLVNAWEPNIEKEWQRLAAFFEVLEPLGKPAIFCSGNHDVNLIRFLSKRKTPWKNLFWDGWHLDLHGIRIRSIGYQNPLPDHRGLDDIWLYHEPPENSPLAKGKTDKVSFGCPSLESMVYYQHELLPSLVIGGHQHRPIKWHWKAHDTLFLNSGFCGKPQYPSHLVLEIIGGTAVVKLNGKDPAVTHALKRSTNIGK